MIKTTWAKLNERPVATAMKKLYNAEGIDANTSYRIAKLIEASENAMKHARNFLAELSKEHGLSGDAEAGEVFKSEEDAQAFQKKFEEKMLGTEVEIKANKIPWKAISHLKILTPIEFTGIDEFLEGQPDPEEEPNKIAQKLVLANSENTPSGLRG